MSLPTSTWNLSALLDNCKKLYGRVASFARAPWQGWWAWLHANKKKPTAAKAKLSLSLEVLEERNYPGTMFGFTSLALMGAGFRWLAELTEFPGGSPEVADLGRGQSGGWLIPPDYERLAWEDGGFRFQEQTTDPLPAEESDQDELLAAVAAWRGPTSPAATAPGQDVDSAEATLSTDALFRFFEEVPFDPSLAAPPQGAGTVAAGGDIPSDTSLQPQSASASPPLVQAGEDLSWAGNSFASQTESASAQSQEASAAEQPIQPSLQTDFGKLPVTFEENVGQVDDAVAFQSRGPGYQLFFTQEGATLALHSKTDPEEINPLLPEIAPGTAITERLDIRVVGADPDARLIGRDQLHTHSNYYRGDFKASNVPNFAEVVYENVYEGIDQVWHAADVSGREVQYDFVVAPGADASQIALRIDGALTTRTDTEGNLVLGLRNGELMTQAPVLYQEDAYGRRTTVSGSYRVNVDGSIGFEVGSYDSSRALVIDPTLVWGTYFGGAGNDFGYDIAVNPSGQIYVVGTTASTDFPTSVPYQTNQAGDDAFVFRLSHDGQKILYSTYLGGDDTDEGRGIALDVAGNAYITGWTESSDFPTSTGAFQESHPANATSAYAVKLNPNGNFLLGTHIRDVDTYDSTGRAIDVDTQGRPYITGWDFQLNGYVAVLESDFSTLAYADTRFFGAGTDTGFDILLDHQGGAYVAGDSSGDAALSYVEFEDPTNNSQFQTFGGSGTDVGHGVALGRDHVYLVGTTDSTDLFSTSSYTTTSGYDATHNGGKDAFLVQYAIADLSQIDPNKIATYLGGSGDDEGRAVAIDYDGAVYISGWTGSTNFPTLGAIPSSAGSGTSAFVTRFTDDFSTLSYSTKLGGSGTDKAHGIALDYAGHAYLTGETSSTNFPTQDPLQSSNAGGSDVFVSKIRLSAEVEITSISSDTGVADDDAVTTDTTLSISGTATVDSTVTLYLKGVGELGTTTADSNGDWTYNYTATTLEEGTHAFTARATLSDITSEETAPFLVSVDTTAAAVALYVASSTADRSPKLRVTARDRGGIGETTTVTLDVDLDNDGNFTDPGESGYQTATMTHGVAEFEADPTSLTAGSTYKFRARVDDLAGNEGTSATMTVAINSETTWTVSDGLLTTDPLAGNRQLQEGVASTAVGFDLDLSPGYGGGGIAYNSDRVTPKPIVHVQVQTPNNAALPTDLTATLTWNGASTYSDTFSLSSYDPGDLLTLGVQVTTAVTTTGRYTWTMDVSDGTSNWQVTGRSFVVVEDTSEWGAGWTYAGTDRLVDITASGGEPAGKLRVYGTGGHSFYAYTGSAYTSPTGDNGTLTSITGGYKYTTPDGREWHFDTNGYQTKFLSADGYEMTTFSYNGSNELTGVAFADGALATVTLSAGKVTTVASDDRTWTMTHTSEDLTAVDHPDASTVTFTYNGDSKLTKQQHGDLESSNAYDSSGLLESFTLGTGSEAGTYEVDPVLAKGLGSTVAAGALRASVTDPLDRTTASELDDEGRQLKLIAADGAEQSWTRDSNGWVTSHTEQRGFTTSYTLDSKGYTTRVDNPDGSHTSAVYDAANHHTLTKFIDEEGGITSYGYNTAGQLTDATIHGGSTTTYAYNASGLLESVEDALNNVTTTTFDSSRRAETVTFADGGVATTAYDGHGNASVSSDQVGNVTTMTYDAMGRSKSVAFADGTETSMVYSQAGQMISSTDQMGVVSASTYDTRGQLTSSVEGLESNVERNTLSLYDEAGQVTDSRDSMGGWEGYEYDELGQVIIHSDTWEFPDKSHLDIAGYLYLTEDALGFIQQNDYNSRGWRVEVADNASIETAFVYDQRGNLVVQVDADGVTTYTTDIVTTYTYADCGCQTGMVDSEGNQFTTVRDAVRRVVAEENALNETQSTVYDEVGRVVASVNPEGERVTTLYDLAGNATGTIDAEGNQSTVTYDSMNRQETIEDAEGNVTTMVRDDRGAVVKTIDPLDRTTTQVYDDLGQLIETIDADGESTHRLLNASGAVVATTDSEERSESSFLDVMGREVAREDNQGNLVLKEYDAAGNLISETDALGNKIEYRYDNLHQLIATEDAEGGITTQTWDVRGNRISITDPVGNTTTFVYNSLNQEIERKDPHGNSLTYAYDAAGRMTSQTDRLGRRKDFMYDDAGRLTKEVWKDASNVTVNTFTFTYDNNGNLETAEDDDGLYTMNYDGLNRMTSQEGPFETLTFSYDAAGNRTVLEDSEGGVLTSTFDNQNRLESRKFDDGSVTLMYDVTYNDVGQKTKIERYSDLDQSNKIGQSAYTYTSGGWLNTIDHADSTNTVVVSYTHDYEAGGRLQSETKNNTERTFGYDNTNQLTDDDGSTYTYDANGNRTMNGYTTGTNNELTNDGTWTFTYDVEGNLSTKSAGPLLEKWFYTYDNDNRLETVRKTSDGTTDVLRVTYAYDAFDHRIEKALWESGIGTTTERYVYDGEEIILDLNGSNVLQMRYIIGQAPDEMIARINSSSTVHWYLTDRMGTVRDLADSNGDIAKTIDYDAFGAITNETATGIAIKRTLNGMVYEAKLGFNTTTNRVYMIDTGRWIQTDFIWFNAQDTNLYRAMDNNVTNLIDPTGLESDWVDATQLYLILNPGTLPIELTNSWMVGRDPKAVGFMRGFLNGGLESIQLPEHLLVQLRNDLNESASDPWLYLGGPMSPKWMWNQYWRANDRTIQITQNAIDTADRCSKMPPEEALGWLQANALGVVLMHRLMNGPGGVVRVGQARQGVIEVSINRLRPIHDVPRPTQPANHIENLAARIQSSGYDVRNPVVAYRLPNGDLVVRSGHHRIAAMRQLGERTIPTRIVEAGSGNPVGEAFILEVGETTGLYQTSYRPSLTPVQQAEVNALVQQWRRQNGFSSP